MKPHTQDVIAHGEMGGLLAGLVVAVWFFVLDLASGAPFRTPITLAETLLGRDVAGASGRLVLAYTVVHFGVFVVLGVVTAALLRALRLAPGLLLGVVFGIGVLDAVYYAGLLITGANMTAALPAAHVVGSNALAGMVLMAYLHRAWGDVRPFGLAVLKGEPLLRAGLLTGLLGAASVALWFFALDIVMGRPFHTPAALGAVLLLGAEQAGDVSVGFGIVLLYTMVHLLAFWIVGTLFVLVAERIEQIPGLWLLAVMAFIVLEGVFVPVVALAGSWVLGTVAWWAILVGNVLAVLAMGWWVWRTHPRLRERLRDEQLQTAV